MTKSLPRPSDLPFSRLRYQPALGLALAAPGLVAIALVVSSNAWAEPFLDFAWPVVFLGSLLSLWKHEKGTPLNPSYGSVLIAMGLPTLTIVAAKFLYKARLGDSMAWIDGSFLALMTGVNLWFAWRYFRYERQRVRLVA